MMNDSAIAFDVDWASDATVLAVAEHLVEQGVKATWFMTHESRALGELRRHPELFELGMHPNFGAGSSHGASPTEVMAHMRGFLPDAVSVRTHTLIQSTPLTKLMREQHGVLNDATTVLMRTPHITPHTRYFDGHAEVTMLPSFWEDDIEMATPHPELSLASAGYQVPGLKIFVFHPIHVVLNSASMDGYTAAKQHVELKSCALGDLAKYTNTTTPGAGTMLRELVQQIKKTSAGLTIAELANTWRASR